MSGLSRFFLDIVRAWVDFFMLVWFSPLVWIDLKIGWYQWESTVKKLLGRNEAAILAKEA